MKIKQLSIFLQNRMGSLSKPLEVLTVANVNIRAMCMADTSEFGILRLVVDDPEKGKEEAFLQRIEETIRRAIAESPIGNLTTLMRLFQTIPAVSAPTTAVTQPEPHMEEQPEEDWSAADDFMSGV
jgi:hypothetical protein